MRTLYCGRTFNLMSTNSLLQPDGTTCTLRGMQGGPAALWHEMLLIQDVFYDRVCLRSTISICNSSVPEVGEPLSALFNTTARLSALPPGENGSCETQELGGGLATEGGERRGHCAAPPSPPVNQTFITVVKSFWIDRKRKATKISRRAPPWLGSISGNHRFR